MNNYYSQYINYLNSSGNFYLDSKRIQERNIERISNHYINKYQTNNIGKFFQFFFSNKSRYVIDIHLCGYDPEHENTYYFFRDVHLKPREEKLLKIRLPFISKKFVIEAYSYNQIPFKMYLYEQDLPKRKMILNNNSEEFIDFAVNFCKKAGYLDTGTYKSKNGKYVLEYKDYCYDEIYDIETKKFINKRLTTPAMVESKSKKFHFAKNYIKDYSVLGRLALFCHEFSHVYLNPELGFDKGFESGADINGLHIFMGMGLYPFEFLKGFLYVFDKSRPGAHYNFNKKRYIIMRNFVDKFQDRYMSDDFVFKFLI